MSNLLLMPFFFQRKDKIKADAAEVQNRLKQKIADRQQAEAAKVARRMAKDRLRRALARKGMMLSDVPESMLFSYFPSTFAPPKVIAPKIKPSKPVRSKATGSDLLTRRPKGMMTPYDAYHGVRSVNYNMRNDIIR